MDKQKTKQDKGTLKRKKHDTEGIQTSHKKICTQQNCLNNSFTNNMSEDSERDGIHYQKNIYKSIMHQFQKTQFMCVHTAFKYGLDHLC